MDKKRPFSKLKKSIENLFDPQLKMSFFALAYPIKNQWKTDKNIPRFYVKLDKEIIWDFPKNFDELKNISFYSWSEENGISALTREYIDTPLANILNHTFELDSLKIVDYSTDKEVQIELKLIDLFRAADRRLGQEKLKKWASTKNNPLIDKILSLRFDN